MTASRQLFLLAFFLAASALLIKTVQVAFTPDLRIALEILGRGIINNVVVQALGITLALVGFVSGCVWCWERGAK